MGLDAVVIEPQIDGVAAINFRVKGRLPRDPEIMRGYVLALLTVCCSTIDEQGMATSQNMELRDGLAQAHAALMGNSDVVSIQCRHVE